jgi:predicted carbohydrate-binding protein with CBM5 and CBM33 domain
MIRQHNSRRLALVAAAFSAIGIAAADAFAHGTIVDSRVYRVAKAGQAANLMGAWTNAMYDWAADSNTFTDYADAGFEYSWHVPDGTIGRAGKNDGTNGTLNFNGIDAPGAWPTSPATAGTVLPQKWVAPAPHDPSYFDVWITKSGFDVTSQTMGWSNLQKLGRWEGKTSLPVTTTPNGGLNPVTNSPLLSYDWSVPIPADRSGRAAIVTVWQRRDSAGEAFFSVQDIMIAPGGPTWNQTGGGGYGTASFWSGGVVPNGVGATANFGSSITAASTVNVGISPSLGTVRFNSANAYTLTGTGVVMLQNNAGTEGVIDVAQGNHVFNAGLMLHGSATATVAANSSLSFGGMFMFSSGNTFTKNGAGTMRIAPTATVSGASNTIFVVAAGRLQIDSMMTPSVNAFAGGGEIRFGSNQNMGSLTMSGATGRVAIDSTSADPLRVKITSIGIGGGTTLDIGDNVLLADYTGDNSPLGQVEFYARLGAQGGHTGVGLISSAAATDNRMAVGIAEASSIGSPATFMGMPIDATTTILRYTLKGDADVNGTVDFQDLVSLAQHYNAAGTWRDGDSDHSGTVDFADLVPLAQNYNRSLAIDGSTLTAIGGSDFAADFALAQSLVPEPATLSTLAIAATAMIRRRR